MLQRAIERNHQRGGQCLLHQDQKTNSETATPSNVNSTGARSISLMAKVMFREYVYRRRVAKLAYA